ncbi:MAG: site-2 protease family protein [Chloroflexi bacterium]|nr:site-2 protease family protein [Chloroflexota bacterium]
MDRTLEPSFAAGRLLGIRIGLSASWFVVFALVTWSLGAAYFPAEYPWWPAEIHWAMAISGSALFFGSVLIHELAHSVVAVRCGIPVTRITLFIFGGLAQVGREAPTPRIEASVAAAGPAASLILGIIFGFLYLASRTLSSPLASLSLWLAIVNGSLALFNLIPAFPLDGGRLLRAGVWSVTSDHGLATRLSSWAGQFTGILLVLYGLYSALGAEGGLLNGVWAVLVGWFLHNAALGSYRASKASDELKAVTAEDVMARDVVPVPVNATVAEFVNGYLMRRRHGRFPVVDGIQLVGTVGLEEVRKVSMGRRTTTWIQKVMRSAERYPPLGRREPADQALQRLNEMETEELPVVDEGRVIGMLSRADLLKLVQVRGILRK